MTLVFDTGPLLAALDSDDPWHRHSAELLASTRERKIVPAPVLPELDHMVRSRIGPTPFLEVMDDINGGALLVEDLTAEDMRRCAEILRTYADAELGFVDAAVFAVVERFGETKLATLDRRHFSLMRPRHVESLELLPA